MKFVYFTLSFLIVTIIAGVIASLYQENASQNTMQSISEPRHFADTAIVGKIAFEAVFDDENYYDLEGIAISLQDNENGIYYEIASDKDGLFYLPNIQEGKYEITKFRYEKKRGKYDISYIFKTGLFFEAKQGQINNLGMIYWTYDKNQKITHSKDYSLPKTDFETKHNLKGKIWSDINIGERAPFLDKRETFDNEHWDITLLDTARDTDYLNAVEKDIILEMNKARSNPKKYADLYIKPMLGHYNGALYAPPNKLPSQTHEGEKAARECYDVLSRTSSVQILTPSKRLSRAAKDHAQDQSKTGGVGHSGRDGKGPYDRIKRYGGNYKLIGENIAYGPNNAREIIVGLLIDDGVSSRGHRDNIMHKEYNQAGAATAPHNQYGVMCVIEYAAEVL